MWRFKESKRGIKNLWKWLPIIWKDRDWDHFYIYEIIEFKLRKQANYIGTMDRHTRAQEDARDMLICADLINKIKTNHYSHEYFDYQELNYEFIPIEDKPGLNELKIDTVFEDFDSYFNKYPSWYRRAIKHMEKNQSDSYDKNRIAMTMSDLREQKAKELLFKIIPDKIDGWWD